MFQSVGPEEYVRPLVNGVVDGDASGCRVEELKPEEEVVTDRLWQWSVVCFDACTMVADTSQKVSAMWDDVADVV
eukprot:7523397-Ditylum_brightwellii.AAC.1